MQQNMDDDNAMLTAREFREILDDVSSHCRFMGPTEMETFSYYLLDSLEGSAAVKGHDQDDYLHAIHDFLTERFPGYNHPFLFVASWQPISQTSAQTPQR